jgi:hypothetical protein
MYKCVIIHAQSRVVVRILACKKIEKWWARCLYFANCPVYQQFRKIITDFRIKRNTASVKIAACWKSYKARLFFAFMLKALRIQRQFRRFRALCRVNEIKVRYSFTVFT